MGNETSNNHETGNLQQGVVMRSAIGHSVNGDDMNWTVDCPNCDKEYEFTGYFDSGDEYYCKCGCTFKTSKVWIDDSHYIV